MAETEPVYRTRMRGMEAEAFLYELPELAGGLLLGAGLALVFAYLTLYRDAEVDPRYSLAMMGVFIAAGLFMVFRGASYYCREVVVYRDRLHFRMLFSHRVVGAAEIAALRPLSAAEARRTFLRFRCHRLTPAISGVVLLERRGGWPWAFSPEDPEAFLAAARPLAGGTAVAGDPVR